MKKYIFILFIALIFILAACEESGVSTGGEGNSVEKDTTETESAEAAEETESEPAEEEEEESGSGKLVDATSYTTEAAGMKVGLGEIKIEEDGISVGINSENTTDGVLMFYPDMGQVVVGDMQMDANMFFTEGDIGGEVQGGVKQDAVIKFVAPEGKTIDVDAVSEIRLLLDEVMTEDFMTTEPVEFTVTVE